MAKPLPPQLMFGFECEVSGGARDLAERLYSLGMLPDSHHHCYHCDCDDCDPDPDRPNVFTLQEDCTVAGEFISRPLFWQRPETHEAIRALSQSAIRARAHADSNAGCHVHVSAGHLTRTQRADVVRTVVAYEEDYGRLASGKAREVRGYNARLHKPRRDLWYEDDSFRCYRGSWVSIERNQTIEFRLWNGTVTDWRIRMYAGVSLATVAAVMDGHVADYEPGDTLADHLADYLPDDVPELMARQMAYAS